MMTTVVFILTYIALAIGSVPGLRIDRAGISVVGAAAMLVIGSISFPEAMRQTDWATIIILFSLMVIVAQLTESGLLAKFAAKVVPERLSPRLTLALTMAATAFTSAFITNDIAVLAFIPILITRLKAKGLHPVPFVLGCTFAANIGSATTIIGNPQNMIIAQSLHINFLMHALWAITPVVVSLVVVWILVQLMCGPLRFHEDNLERKATQTGLLRRTSAAPTKLRPVSAIIGALALVVVVALFLMPVSRPIAAIAVAGILLLNRVYSTDVIFGRVDWGLLVLVVSLNIVVNAFATTGLPKEGVADLSKAGIDLAAPWQLALVTVVLSNLVNNIPAVLLLLKVVPESVHVGYVLAVASTFAGNLLIIGSLANIIMVRQAQELGITISFWRHARVGIPVTIASTAILIGWIVFVG